MARVLVIEDDPENLDFLLYLLTALGHTAYPARNGVDGLIRAALENPDLILCDINLPLLDGYGVVRQLKANTTLRRVPLIAVTALAMLGDREMVLSRDFDGYLAKPVDPETFGERVEEWLALRTGDQEAE